MISIKYTIRKSYITFATDYKIRHTIIARLRYIYKYEYHDFEM